ncbi:hypothetical protein A5765_07175 [Mycolicibacterium celeriflavum]|uniref:Uncharacterized protein n=1 Tax=Mycolicibacterium celeriflavum TaxID=1249101 RepID=A0A1X0BVX9_MYCCF|nr:hypothetical protein [Mycolicibacterium celeriflavum]MCV7238574.1 hypothetical protein [Mycolicibacterium celeriflavum]OBG16509.1 hypothetical protein A5765_07175 [Mycolicibacterium celeriflavum]ORA48411.1 hypothetical protein BST21_09790 [Mycolicibacterium celeriflavum]BBY46137.1 hypothetical protein MCEL_44320 [Mycolicibacterium celeriflavum]
MSLSTALRVASIVIVVKAVLIGAVYWRRAVLMGRPVDAGVIASTVLAGVVGVAVVITAIAVLARYLRDHR